MAFWDRHWGDELDVLGTEDQHSISDVKSVCVRARAYVHMCARAFLYFFVCVGGGRLWVSARV